MPNYAKLTIFIFGIIPFSIIYFLTLFGLQELRNEFILKFLEFVFVIASVALGCVFIVLGLFKLGTSVIDRLSSRSIEINSPTPSAEVQNIEARGATVQEFVENPPQSRGESKEFNFAKYKQGSPEAANAYKQSPEHINNMEKIRTIDEIIADARRRITA